LALAQVLALVGPAAATFDTPLYLYTSTTNNDTALLATVPSSASVDAAGSYTRVFAEPVAFAASAATATGDVPLYAYWSAERKDIQTSNWDLSTLNQHGGNYTLLGVVGYLQSQPANGSWWTSLELVPLQLSYSAGRADAITGPMNAADINALDIFSKAGGVYTGKQLIVGYALAGSCPICSTALAAAFPSAGGADCPVACADGTSSFTSIYPVGRYAGLGADQFRASMLNAGNILKRFGSVVSTESGTGLHVSFSYLCCYSTSQKAAIQAVLKGIKWPPLNISFGAPVVRVDNEIVPGGWDPLHRHDKDHHFSVIVLLDEASNTRMEQWVATVEQTLRNNGFGIHLPRSKQQPFHSTLGVVNGLEYPVEAALQAINKAIPPHSWTAANLTLGVPDI